MHLVGMLGRFRLVTFMIEIILPCYYLTKSMKEIELRGQLESSVGNDAHVITFCGMERAGRCSI